MKHFLLLSLVLAGAAWAQQPPMSIREAHAVSEAEWAAAEPNLFLPDKQKAYLGTIVRCSGKPLSLKFPITFRTKAGTIVRLTKLQGADKEELATFRKPPSEVTVWGPILSIEPSTRTVTIKAVSTSFTQ